MKDLKDVEVKAHYHPSYKAGGQQTGMPPQEITATHLPSGISASSGYENRSQHKARNLVLAMLEYGLLEAGYGNEIYKDKTV